MSQLSLTWQTGTYYYTVSHKIEIITKALKEKKYILVLIFLNEKNVWRTLPLKFPMVFKQLCNVRQYFFIRFDLILY